MRQTKSEKRSDRKAFLSLAAMSLMVILFALVSVSALAATPKPAPAAPKPAVKGPACTYKIIFPGGSHVWTTGNTAKIMWSTGGPSCGGKVKLDYSGDGGKTWTAIIASTNNNGEYAWKVSSKPSTSARIKVTDLGHPDSSGQSEIFTVSVPGPATAKPAPAAPAPPVCSLSLNTPKGGENWKVGSASKITWAKTGPGCGPKVKLDYSTDGGTTWLPIIADTNNTGEYAWKVPNQPTAKARVKVTDKKNPNTNIQSAGNFTIAR